MYKCKGRRLQALSPGGSPPGGATEYIANIYRSSITHTDHCVPAHGVSDGMTSEVFKLWGSHRAFTDPIRRKGYLPCEPRSVILLDSWETSKRPDRLRRSNHQITWMTLSGEPPNPIIQWASGGFNICTKESTNVSQDEASNARTPFTRAMP